MKHILFTTLIALLLFTVCEATSSPMKLPENPNYILSGDNTYRGFRNNQLTIFETNGWKVHRKIDLPHSWARNFSRDFQGRIWIGFSGDFDKTDDLVQVYSGDGNLLKSIHPCNKPEAGISFSGNYAFVACAENGFRGKVAVINLQTFAVEKLIELSVPNDNPLILISSAANKNTVIVSGSTSGPIETGYAVITLIDTNSLDIQTQLEPMKDTDIWRIIPYKNDFYLLNVGGWRLPREEAKDVLILTPGNPPTITSLAIRPSPLWGVIEDDILYTYHNPTWNQTNNDTQRQIAQFNLTQKQVKSWTLPNEWEASDLAVVDRQIILSKWDGNSGTADGLYLFNPKSNQLEPLLNVPDASGLIISK